MSAVSTISEPAQETQGGSLAATTHTVVCLGPSYENASPEDLAPVLQVLASALGERSAQTVIAYPVTDPHGEAWQYQSFQLQPYLPSARVQAIAIQTSTTYLSLFEVMRARSAQSSLLLGAEAHTLSSVAIRGLLDAVESGADATLARYDTAPNQALINAAILRPLSRAVYGANIAFPLALDVALTYRMAERMASLAQRLTASSQPEGVVWPVSEAATAGYSLAEVEAGARDLPRPAGDDLTSILNATVAPLFNDIEAKASYWQRTRPSLPVRSVGAARHEVMPAEPVQADEIAELIETFRIGYGNLHEIWSLVLPPQTLLGLKRLAAVPHEQFVLQDSLWVRVVYDFLLAHRLPTINRGHLMGALTPLYLAWVASHLLRVGNGIHGADAQETLARAFEADKPYLVSRWRWPDRFNP